VALERREGSTVHTPSRGRRLIGALVVLSAALLVGVSASGAWAASDRASERGQEQSEAHSKGGEKERDRHDHADADGADAKGATVNEDGTNPPGNNGTIKVDVLPDEDDARDTETHGCQVQIEFFGFDADQEVIVTFRGQAPTDFGVLNVSPSELTLDGDGVDGGSLDGKQNYDLLGALQASGTAPEPGKGYHVRVEVDSLDAPGGAKKKVFWLPCFPPAQVSGASVSGSSTGGGEVEGAAVVGTQVGALQVAAAEVAVAEVASAEVTPAAAPGDGPAEAAAVLAAGAEQAPAAVEPPAGRPGDRLEVMGTSFARTGAALALLALLGAALVAGGIVFRRAARARATT
jgi:hypothetical protein